MGFFFSCGNLIAMPPTLRTEHMQNKTGVESRHGWVHGWKRERVRGVLGKNERLWWQNTHTLSVSCNGAFPCQIGGGNTDCSSCVVLKRLGWILGESWIPLDGTSVGLWLPVQECGIRCPVGKKVIMSHSHCTMSFYLWKIYVLISAKCILNDLIHLLLGSWKVTEVAIPNLREH